LDEPASHRGDVLVTRARATRLSLAAFTMMFALAATVGPRAADSSLPASPARIGVAIDNGPTSASGRDRALQTERAAAEALRALGYRTVPVNRMCDDLDGGARHVGVRYYVRILIPAREGAQARMELHEVGNGHVLHTVEMSPAQHVATAVARLMDRRSWSLAHLPRVTC
jgi:hypothetical protein